MFEASFESLKTFQCPEWFRDAKFGIWSHWGPQSVPMCGDWYARNMYIQGTEQYEYHLRTYGHPSKFGYKDICTLWKAEKFDPDALMEKYYKAGARYFVAQASHHDHFFNYDSKLNRFNSVQVGPHKDICGLWKAAAKKYGLPFGMTEHLGASFAWWRSNKGADAYGPYVGVPYDGNDPAYRDFYHDNYEHVAGPGEPDTGEPWTDYAVPADSRAEFAVRITGDSMEPELHDGEIALCVKRRPEQGELAVLMVNGSLLCKQFITDRKNIYLRSLNRARKDGDCDIWASGNDTVRCYGTVLHRSVPLAEDIML